LHAAGSPLLPVGIPAWAEEEDAEEEETLEESEEDLDPLFRGLWKWFRPGLSSREREFAPLLCRPLRTGNNNFFHHLLLIPPLESFPLVPAGGFFFSMGIGHSYGTDATEVPGNRFRASFSEMRVDVGWGLSRIFELRGGFNIARFSFDNLGDVRATQERIAVFPDFDFDPGLGLGHVTLGIKIHTRTFPEYDIGISTVLTLKIPVGKSDFLTSGRGDVAMALVGTYKLSLMGGTRVYFHVNAGWAFFDEENVFPQKVYINSASFYGLGIVLPLGPKLTEEEDGFNWAVILQCQGHENALARLDQPNSSPATVHFGLRGAFGEWFFEAGAGFGVTKQGSADYAIDCALTRAF
jgi:hypothetical protein